jgi:hypothetical protein
MIASFLLTGNIIYNFAQSSIDYKIYNMLGIMGMHIGNKLMQRVILLGLFLADCFIYGKRRVPVWYLRLKLFTSVATILSLSGICMLLYSDEAKLKIENDPFRKFVPSEDEILKTSK